MDYKKMLKLHGLVGIIVSFFFLSTSAFAGGMIKGKIDYKKKRWIRDTFVYLENVPGKWEPQEAEMNQVGSTFIPKYLPIIVGSTVKFLNSDPTEHNVYSPDHETFNLGKAIKGEVLSHTFNKVGGYTQLCKLHAAMVAFVVVLPNPYYGQSDKKGNFVIKDVPPGHYRLITWNQRYKADHVEVDVKDGESVEVTIKLHR